MWYSGIDAHLDVDTHAGQAWVCLCVGLGHLPHPHVQRKKESPSRQRRRARWAETRRLAAEVADNEEVTARTNVVAEAEKVTASDGVKADTVKVNAVVEKASRIESVDEIAANLKALNDEVRDEFCANEEYSSSNIFL